MDTAQSDCTIMLHKSDFSGSYPITCDTKGVEVTFKQLKPGCLYLVLHLPQSH